ncbi:MAG: IS66 family insertion sequence element accessory protein TnpB [Lacisediminimonas sp.]|nr:IS66 family insertion sequence element accessory protein TnpB [Lacisediminimonas sp.]
MVATKPIDFRKGHDRLAAMVKTELRKDPFTVARQAIARQSAERGHGLRVPRQEG